MFKISTMERFCAFCFYITLLCITASTWGCGSSETPLDAKTREAIDSLSTAEIRLLRVELDSQCQMARVTQMPQLVDSIKQVRLREIQEQLKTVPR
ncbi:MAG: hypothetical protein LCH81_05425 [Bacteroidetes bacterium]|nr:hypothetical protein [Bacteroidota bacterium]